MDKNTSHSEFLGEGPLYIKHILEKKIKFKIQRESNILK